MLDEKDRQLQALRNSVEIYAKERSDLVECLKYFVSNKYEMPLEKAIERSKAVLKGKNLWDTKMGERQ
jgi:hypothetical protein